MPRRENRAAVLTGPGPAAIAVVRLSGPLTATFLERHVHGLRPSGAETGCVARASLRDASAALDDILVTFRGEFPPNEARLHLHGNPWLVQRCLDLARNLGFEIESDPGDLWHADDPLEAELWAHLPKIMTRAGVDWLIQEVSSRRDGGLGALLEEDAVRIRLEWYSQPVRVALVGPPNAGKSTLINRLAARPVSLVSPTPGATRDWVAAASELCGYPVIWLDSAGLRETTEELEAESVRRTLELVRGVDAIVLVLDASGAAGVDELRRWLDITPACVAVNKCDLADGQAALSRLPAEWRRRAVRVSAETGAGLAEFERATLQGLGREV